MRRYKVRNISHLVYENQDEVPKNLSIIRDWKVGDIGDWVRADDGCIIQVLRRGSMLKAKGRDRIREYIGTCTGTFPIGPRIKMDTSRRANIYSFGGSKSPEDILLDRERLTKAEHLFVLYVTQGVSPEKAYVQAYPTNNIRYAVEKAGTLIKTERIRTAMKEELKPVLEELGVNEEYILKGIKSEAETADKSDTRLKALFKLSDIMDLEDKNQTKVTQIQGGVFRGFIEEDIKKAERPKEIE
jgi:hypothetical protein